MPSPLAKAPTRVDLYNRDYFDWTVEQGRALRTLRPGGLDWENVAEEIESLGRSDKRSIEANLAVVLLHLLKWRYQPKQRKSGWKPSIDEHRHRIEKLLRESPSLRSFPAEALAEEYRFARPKAAEQTGLPIGTFPDACPFDIRDVLDPGYLPD